MKNIYRQFTNKKFTVVKLIGELAVIFNKTLSILH